MARHQDKLKAEQAREDADADKRAANVKAFEERKAESEERQRKVAERKAQKEKEAQEKGKSPADGQ
jgi:colicin import membrane protein